MYFNLHILLIQNVVSHKGGKGTSYIDPFIINLLDGFFYIGVQIALPVLIISRTKKAVEFIKCEYAYKSRECNVIKPQHSTLKCIEATQNEKTLQLFSPLEW